MQTIFIALAAILSVGIVALHVLSVALADKKGNIFNFINIGLHIALVFVLLFGGAELELLALAFMVSLLIYVLLVEIKRKAVDGRKGKEDNDK